MKYILKWKPSPLLTATEIQPCRSMENHSFSQPCYLQNLKHVMFPILQLFLPQTLRVDLTTVGLLNLRFSNPTVVQYFESKLIEAIKKSNTNVTFDSLFMSILLHCSSQMDDITNIINSPGLSVTL
ncbi:hypothetical protein AVEN_162832-1 [Araneus ventricosus]|uniref:Uncharacterized protein n=1 Tax=Araneus ventricosus TaxID=182803 RepID=A0A4Y2C608_ARAVE|nr:hypothetical protein AVEN_162832-1 [Araneus ventricosus]